jgi:hypothetical protein
VSTGLAARGRGGHCPAMEKYQGKKLSTRQQVVYGIGTGALLMLLTSTCSKTDDAEQPTTQAERERPQPKSATLKVTSAEHGDAWPFTADEAVLNCLETEAGSNIYMTYAQVGGKTYSLNAPAFAAADRFGWEKDEGPIWRDNPLVKGTKINILPMKLLALKGCQEQEPERSAAEPRK